MDPSVESHLKEEALLDCDQQEKTREKVKKECRITLIGMIVNILLAALKFALGIVGRSQALVADGVHSLSDITSDIAVYFGIKLWSAPADESHPYGHWRMESMISILIGVIIAAVAIGIGFNSVVTFRDEDLTQPRMIAFVGALVSIVAKEFLYRWTKKVGKETKSSAIIANAWHHRSDAFSSIPVALAVIASVISPKLAFMDHVGAMVVSLVILIAAWNIVKTAISTLADRGVASDVKNQIESIVMTIKGVRSVHAIRSRSVGPGIHVDLHLMVDPEITVRKGHDISENAKKELIENGPDVIDVIVHIEPFEKLNGE
ncbi:cation transporter [bacterium]|nr:cation transporter [bacterium]